MRKVKMWTPQEETELKALLKAGTPMNTIAAKLGRTSTAVTMKCSRIGFSNNLTISSEFSRLPRTLPSIEETLKILAGALKKASKPGLDKVEVQRLQAVATLAREYKVTLADYINYRGIEEKLNEMEPKYAKLLQEKTKNDEARADNTPAS